MYSGVVIKPESMRQGPVRPDCLLEKDYEKERDCSCWKPDLRQDQDH